jgi:glutamine synthetase
MDALLKDNAIKYLLAQFVDINGLAKAKLVPMEFATKLYEEGVGVAGGAIAGMGMEPHQAELMLIGERKTIKPMSWMPGTATINCLAHVNGKLHPLDSRTICHSILADFKQETGLDVFVGLEPEFFLLRKNSGNGRYQPALSYDTEEKPCYDFKSLFGVKDFLFALHGALKNAGIKVYQIDHEDGNGQYEINFEYDQAITTADNFLFCKLAAVEIAREQGLICSFMPKPFADRAGSGMHVHISLGARKGENAFYAANDPQNLNLSPLAYKFLAGILKHAPAITAIASPSINSYKRLVDKGSRSGVTWAPTSICYGDNNRTAMIRIVDGHLEIRTPDSLANPYLLIAAITSAGLDGIRNELKPGSPFNENTYKLSAKQLEEYRIFRLPKSLSESLQYLASDSALCKSLSYRLVENYCEIKEKEINAHANHISDWETSRYIES